MPLPELLLVLPLPDELLLDPPLEDELGGWVPDPLLELPPLLLFVVPPLLPLLLEELGPPEEFPPPDPPASSPLAPAGLFTNGPESVGVELQLSIDDATTAAAKHRE